MKRAIGGREGICPCLLVKSHIECEGSVTYIGGTILEIDVGGKVRVVGRVAAGVIGDSLCVCVCVCVCVHACVGACVCMCVRAVLLGF